MQDELRSPDGRNETVAQNNKVLVSLDIENNKFQELEGALFLHLGLSGPIQLRHIRASKNQIKYVSNRIKDCVSLVELRLSNNLLAHRLGSVGSLSTFL